MQQERRYPLGIQTFSEIIQGKYVYIDKTDLVWELTKTKYVFLSRPRRFGKSLLTTTLKSYFQGERELFEGLKIMDYEHDWEQYPVLHLDLSIAKSQSSAQALRDRIMLMLEQLTDIYGKKETEKTPGGVLTGLIHRAHEKTGKKVVILIDEYDAPLLEVLHENTIFKDLRTVMQELYQPLKACEAHIRFCFLTGITKFSQLSIFSTINNIRNVSMLPQFSAICGITEQELHTDMAQDIALLAKNYECSVEEMKYKLKERYDGYHFTHPSEDIYNPYSLINAFADLDLNDYWFNSGTPTYLIHQMQRFGTDITGIDGLQASAAAFDRPTESMEDALPLLYQSGYLTIKDFDRESRTYTLGIPNGEVRTGYAEGLLPIYAGLRSNDVQIGFALKFWRALKKDDIDLAMREMQTYMAGIPYVEGFKKKLAEAATAEGFYEYTLYLIFSMLNVYVRTQVKCQGGRVDMVVWMPSTTYVFEFKTQGTPQEALAQIDSKGYAIPFEGETRRIVKVGILFDKDTRQPKEWAVAE